MRDHDCRQHIRREVRISGVRRVCSVCDATLWATVSVEDDLPPRRDRSRVRFTPGGYLRGGGQRLGWRFASLVLLFALAACGKAPAPPSCETLEIYDTTDPGRLVATVTLCDGKGDAVTTKRPFCFREVAE